MADSLQLKVVLGLVDKVSAKLRGIMDAGKGTGTALGRAQAALAKLGGDRSALNGFTQARWDLRATTQELAKHTQASKVSKAALEARLTAQRALAAEMKVARTEWRQQARAFNQLKQPSADVVAGFEAQRKAITKLEAHYAAHTAATRALQKEDMKSDSVLKKLTRTQEAQAARVEAARQKLEAAGLSTSKLGARQRELRVEMAKATEQIKRQEAAAARLQRAQALASKMTRGGMVTAAHGAGFYATGSMAMQRMDTAIQPGIDLQASMRDISITGGLDKAQEAALTAQVRADALKFGQTADLISGGLKGLVANGVNDVKQLGAYSGLMARTSVAAGADMNDLAQLITTNTQIFGIAADKMGGALDSMNYAGKRGSFELADMAKWFPVLAPQLKALGITGREAVDSLGAALQVARKGAGTNDEAANNLANYLGKLTSADTIKAFDKAGIDLEKSMLAMAHKGIDPLQGSLQLITRYMESKGPAAAKKFKDAISIEDAEKRAAAMESLSDAFNLGDLFRDKQVLNFLRPALANQGEMQSIKAGASKASGGIDADWAARMEVTQQKLTMFQIKLTELKLKAFDVLSPSLGELANKAGVWLDKLGGFIKAHPVLTGWILKGAAAFALLFAAIGIVLIPLGFLGSMLGHSIMLFTRVGPVTKRFGTWLMRLGPWAKSAGSMVGRALLRIGRGAMSMGRFMGGQLAAGLRIAGGWLARLGPLALRVGAMLGRALLGIGTTVARVGVMLLTNPIFLAFALLAGAAYLIWKNWDGIKAGAILLWQDIGNAVGAVWDWLKARAALMWQHLKTIFGWTPLGLIVNNWGTIKTAFTTIIGGVMTYLKGAWSVITGIFSGDGAKIRAGLQMMWNGINTALGGWPAKLLQIGIDMMRGLVSGIGNMAGAVRDALAGVANGAVGKLKNLLGIKSPSRVFAELGGHTMAGFTQGLLGGQDGAQNALQRIGAGLRKTGAGIALGAATGAVAASPIPPALQARVTPALAPLAQLPALQARIDSRPPLSASAGAGQPVRVVEHRTYEININAAGGDPREIERTVRRVIEDLENERRVRGRAALTDYDE